MTQPSKQLELFDNTLGERADQFFNDLKIAISTLKHHAFLVEGGMGRTIVFDRLLKCVDVLLQLQLITKPLAKKFRTETDKETKKWSVYDPIPVPQEGLTPDDLFYMFNDMRRKYKVTVTKNSRIIEQLGVPAEMHLDEFFKFIDQAIAANRKLCTTLG